MMSLEQINQTQQGAQLIQCFANEFCKISRMAKVGKDVTREMIKLKKIYMAIEMYKVLGKDCVISCFMIKNCNC